MNKRKGFTLIEIALFLAVTAALFIGIALGMENSIFQQRRTDSIQNFLEFMRSIYSKVSNPQSPGAGNSKKEAIYGKLVVFGQDPSVNDDPIYTYDVIGDTRTDIGSGTVASLLRQLNVNVLRKVESGGVERAVPASPEKYDLRWGAGVENTTHGKFVGSIMVVRHPKSGTINTLVMENVAIPVNAQNGSTSDVSGFLTKYLDPSAPNKFTTREVDFCVNPNGVGQPTYSVPRQDIRILENARNASSVELVDLDSDDNRCR